MAFHCQASARPGLPLAMLLPPFLLITGSGIMKLKVLLHIYVPLIVKRLRHMVTINTYIGQAFVVF